MGTLNVPLAALDAGFAGNTLSAALMALSYPALSPSPYCKSILDSADRRRRTQEFNSRSNTQ
jgi:hypothetical protein